MLPYFAIIRIRRLVSKVKDELKLAGVEASDEIALLVVILRELRRTQAPQELTDEDVDILRACLDGMTGELEDTPLYDDDPVELLISEGKLELTVDEAANTYCATTTANGRQALDRYHFRHIREALRQYITENCEKFFGMFVDPNGVSTGPPWWVRLLGD